MKETVEDFLNQMIYFFPQKQDEYFQKRKKFFEGLEIIIIEDIFMPEIIKLLENNSEKELIKAIFNYFEIVSKDTDEELLNIFSITALEILGNDKKILETAREYMGATTAVLQREADRSLGRNGGI